MFGVLGITNSFLVKLIFLLQTCQINSTSLRDITPRIDFPKLKSENEFKLHVSEFNWHARAVSVGREADAGPYYKDELCQQTEADKRG